MARRRARPRAAHHHDPAVAGQFGGALGDRAERDERRARGVPGVPFVRLADVEKYCPVADQDQGLGRPDFGNAHTCSFVVAGGPAISWRARSRSSL